MFVIQFFVMTYSIDLRKRVLEYIGKGFSVKEAVVVFGVSIRSIMTWGKRKKEGILPPKVREAKPRKIDNILLMKYLEKNPDAYLREIADEFGVTIQAIFYACKRLKITLKKRRLSIGKEMKKKESNISTN